MTELFRAIYVFAALSYALTVPRHPAYAQSTAHLLFWDVSDVTDVAGPIRFGAEKLQPLILGGWPGGHFGTAVKRDADRVWVYGWSIRNREDRDRRMLEIRRTSTGDGTNFTEGEVVLAIDQPGAQGFVNIVHRPTDNRLFAFSWEAGAMRVWRGEADGTNWADLGVAYRGHDAMNIIWHPGLNKFLNFQTYLEPWPEKNPDDNLANLRRVLQFKTSDDGIHWEDISPDFLGGEPFWEPDAGDDPATEFYRVAAFPHLGRYAMLLLVYKADPDRVGQHSQERLRTEWAISRDGLNWTRPFRGTNAEEHLGWTPVQGPLPIDDTLKMYHHADAAEISHDRIFFVTSDNQAQFATQPFAMPAGGLFLNANVAISAHSRVEAELLDSNGNVIAGYERDQCVIAGQNVHAIPLSWNGNESGAFAGSPTRVRFHLRDAKIFGVSYKSSLKENLKQQ